MFHVRTVILNPIRFLLASIIIRVRPRLQKRNNFESATLFLVHVFAFHFNRVSFLGLKYGVIFHVLHP